MSDEVTTPKVPSVSGILAPPVYADTEPPVTTSPPVAVVVTESPTPQPQTSMPKESWTVDTSANPTETIELTTQPPTEPSTLEPMQKSMEDSPYTQEPLNEPPWFPKLYVMIDSKQYTATGELRVLSALGNTLSTETYRNRDFGQLWFTNFKGYIKNASTNGLLTSEGDCQKPGLTDTLGNAVLWDFKKVDTEREYDIVAQCGRKLHALPNGTVTLDPIGSSWYIVPVAKVNF